MSNKYQIFVSSTYEDLKEERDRVIQGILEMGHIPVGMEMFSAADETQWQIIARHIEESDYYVVIVAHRYGSMDGSISYTRKEYEYALAHGIPVIGFVIDPSASWPADRIDSDAAMIARLTDFKSLVESKPVGFWANADDLYGKASVALVKTMNAQPRQGWVRASAAIGPEVTSEISRLSSENAKLRATLAEVRDKQQRDNASELAELWAQMTRKKWRYSARFKGSLDWKQARPISYARIFTILAPNMVIEATVEMIDNLLKIHTEQPQESEANENLAVTTVPINERSALLSDFMMLDLMEPSSRRHPVADKAEYWSLSPVGQELLKMRKRAAFASEDEDKTPQSQTGEGAEQPPPADETPTS